MSEFFGLHLVRPHWSYPRKHDSADSGSLHMNNNILVLDKTVVFFVNARSLWNPAVADAACLRTNDQNRKVPVAGNIQ